MPPRPSAALEAARGAFRVPRVVREGKGKMVQATCSSQFRLAGFALGEGCCREEFIGDLALRKRTELWRVPSMAHLIVSSGRPPNDSWPAFVPAIATRKTLLSSTLVFGGLGRLGLVNRTLPYFKVHTVHCCFANVSGTLVSSMMHSAARGTYNSIMWPRSHIP